MGEIKKYLNYINGEWVASHSGSTIEIHCPADQEVVSIVERSNEKDIDEAVCAARKALEDEDWSFNPKRRSRALYLWAQAVRGHHEEIAVLLSLEAGKPIQEARFEVSNAINYLEYSAASVRTLYGSTTTVDKTLLSVLSREPVGVIGVIIPWNYPVTLFMRDMTPALAAGNTVVVKPAEQTSACNMILLELLDTVEEFPKGVINAVTGYGNEAGEALIQHPSVDMISFTGGSVTGKHIMEVGSKTMKKLSLELGGKSANIIFADADLDKALPMAIKGIFSNAGQLCTVGSRLILEESISVKFLDKMKNLVEKMKIGHGRNEDTELGPVVSEKQMNKILAYIEDGKKCAELVTGGYRITDGALSNGWFLAPTIFLNPPVDSKIVQEEIFGPVLVVQTFKTEEEAIELANGTKFGLASGVWSKDIDKAMRVSRKMHAGSCWVNCYNKLFPEAETGGYKQSGIDRAAGVEGFMKYTEVKHICFEFENK